MKMIVNINMEEQKAQRKQGILSLGALPFARKSPTNGVASLDPILTRRISACELK